MPAEAVKPAASQRTPDWLTRAAVLSVFDVDWIQPGGGLDEEAEEELDEFLATACERVVDGTGTPRWQLRDAERTRVLRDTPRPVLRDALRTTTGRPDDPVQAALTRYVSGESAELGAPDVISALGAADLSAELQVSRWAGAATEGNADAAAIQATLDWRAVVECLHELIGRGFVGRADLIQECLEFVAAQGPAKRDGAFLIEGVGGSGKSSVLARLIEELPRQGHLLAYLSFDRGWLLDGGPAALFDELLRQVSGQLPGFYKSSLRIRQLADRSARRAQGYRDIASRGSRYREQFEPELLQELGQLLPAGSQFVIIVDTLEELARRDESVGYEIAVFFADLRRHIPEVRVVGAGRVAPYLQGERHQLAGLTEGEAVRLLRMLTADPGVADDVLRETYRLVGGNPLSLHLAADILSRGGDDPFRMLAVSEGDIQGQLYSRLLEHIRDPEVRAIAHPGLVVRRITPAIIREVLAGPCGVDGSHADRIFYALGKEATLCVRSWADDRALEHRQDVRAIMLPAIQRDRPATTREIHAAAVRYYDNHRNGHLTIREALYHRLMLDQDPDVLDDAWNPNAGTDLATVIDEFPPRAQLYLATKVRKLRLDPAARAAGDDDRWRQAVGPAARLRLESGQPEEALSLVTERRDAQGRPLLADIEVEALERLGRVDEALELAKDEQARAERRGDLDLVRTLIGAQARIFERLRDWPQAWCLLAGLAALDRARRERTDAFDDDVRIRELVVLTSLLRIARHAGRSASDDAEVAALLGETVRLQASTPRRVLAGNPALLRDLAAEIGEVSPETVGLADETLAPEATAIPETTVDPETTAAPESLLEYRQAADEAQEYYRE